jgi:hypothetical protein
MVGRLLSTSGFAFLDGGRVVALPEFLLQRFDFSPHHAVKGVCGGAMYQG